MALDPTPSVDRNLIDSSPVNSASAPASTSRDSSRAPELEAESVEILNTSFSRGSAGLAAAALGLGSLLMGGVAEAALNDGPQADSAEPAAAEQVEEGLEHMLPTRPIDGIVTVQDKAAVEDLIYRSYDPNSYAYSRQYAERELSHMDADDELLEIAFNALDNLDTKAPAWKREALEIFIAARQLGIEFANRVPRQFLEEVIENRQRNMPDGRPLAVITMCKGDHNGAFYLSDTLFEALVKQDYRVMYYEVDSDYEFAHALRGATRPGTSFAQQAAVIIVSGHGNPTSLHFEETSWNSAGHPGNHGILDFSDEEGLRKFGVPDALKPGGQIVLDSCSNGSGREEADNMANFMRRLFPHAKEQGIWSATQSYGPIWLHFDGEGELERVEYPVPEYRAMQEILRERLRFETENT